MCRWTLLHSGQVNVRKSWPNVLGSIAVNLIGEPQAVHCGPWFWVSSMCCLPPQFRALSSPASRPTEADFIGSLAMTSFCTELHFGHSNRRCSKPIGPGLTRASIMRDVQREQRGRSMRVSDGTGEKICFWHDTSLHLGGSVQHSLSPIGPIRGGDQTSVRPGVPEPLVNIAHIPKFNEWTWWGCSRAAILQAGRSS